MPEKYAPASTYPFAINFLLVAAQIWIILTGDRFTYTQRLVVAATGLASIVLVMPYLVQLPYGVNYWVVFAVLLIYGACSGVFQGTIYTMAAYLPFKYMGAVQLGAGFCGLACNLLRGLTLVVFPSGPGPDQLQNAYYSAILFFTVAGCYFALVVLLHLYVIRKNPFFVYYLDWEVAEKDTLLREVEDSELPQDYNMMTSDVASLCSIAKRPAKESLRNFFAVAKENFSLT